MSKPGKMLQHSTALQPHDPLDHVATPVKEICRSAICTNARSGGCDRRCWLCSHSDLASNYVQDFFQIMCTAVLTDLTLVGFGWLFSAPCIWCTCFSAWLCHLGSLNILHFCEAMNRYADLVGTSKAHFSREAFTYNRDRFHFNAKQRQHRIHQSQLLGQQGIDVFHQDTVALRRSFGRLVLEDTP